MLHDKVKKGLNPPIGAPLGPWSNDQPQADSGAGPQGFLGDTILVNGTYAPFVEVPRGWLRLRLLNASNGRRFNFGFDDNRAFHQIAPDGGLLEAPVEERQLVVGPGSRVEIMVDMADGMPVHLMSYTVRDVDHPANPLSGFFLNFFHADRGENQERRYQLSRGRARGRY